MKVELLKDLQTYRDMKCEELEQACWPEGRTKHIDYIIEFANTLSDGTNWKAMIGGDGTVELYRSFGYYQDISCTSEGIFDVFTKINGRESHVSSLTQEMLTAYLTGFEDGMT